MEFFVESFLKASLFPIIVESCYNAGKQIWTNSPLSAIILFLTGFLFTKLGNILVILLSIFLFLKRKDLL